MIRRISFKGCLLALMLGTIFLSGCSRSDSEKESGTRDLNVRLGWQVNANSAGQIVALEKLYYLEEGLRVHLFPGGLTDPSVKTVASGRDHIGFANSPDLVIQARANGFPIQIFGVVHRRGYHAFFVRSGSGLEYPLNWKGRRIGVKFASPTFIHYQAILSAVGLSREDLIEVPIEYGLQPFLSGMIDIYPGALTNEFVAMEMMGIDLSVVDPEAFGIRTFGNVMFATENFLKGNPTLIEGFLRATQRGWQYCMNPDNHIEVIEILKKHNHLIDQRKELVALRKTLEHVQLSGASPVTFKPKKADVKVLGELSGRLQSFGVIPMTPDKDKLVFINN